MTDLKQIAAEMHADAIRNMDARLASYADALDALAAQSQEPVEAMSSIDYWQKRGHHVCAECNGTKVRSYRQAEHLGGQYVNVPCTCAAPQPAPPQPVAPEEFEKALFRFVDQHARAIAPAASGEWTTDEEYAAAKAEVLRLYTLAVGAAVKVPETVAQSNANLGPYARGYNDGRNDTIAEVLRLNAPEAGS